MDNSIVTNRKGKESLKERSGLKNQKASIYRQNCYVSKGMKAEVKYLAQKKGMGQYLT